MPEPHSLPAPPDLLTSSTALLTRRSALRVALFGAVTPAAVLPLIGCSVDTPAPSTSPDTSTYPAATSSPPAAGPSSQAAAPPPAASAGPRVLLAYFSRAGENYSYGGRTDLDVGNTEVAAQMIAELITCDVHRIEAAEAYPESYDATVARNVTEQDDDARPALAEPFPDVSGYDVVLLGSPIWNVRPPMIMNTVIDAVDLTGKRVLPFVTFAVSGLGSTERVYADALPGVDLGEGLAVRGEEVGDARPDIEAWLRQAGLITE